LDVLGAKPELMFKPPGPPIEPITASGTAGVVMSFFPEDNFQP
jgi:hypothetical protein